MGDDDEWRVVSATGSYDTDDTVIVRYRTRDGASGIDVVVPLVTADGTALLVDRGWMPTDNRGAGPNDVPSPPEGEVTVLGWVRADAEAFARQFGGEVLAYAQVTPDMVRLDGAAGGDMGM